MEENSLKIINWVMAGVLIICSGSSVAQMAERGSARDKVDPFGWIVGGAVNVNQQMYKGFEYNTMALPIIGYRGERLQVYGPFVSYDVIKRDNWNFTANLSPRFSGFEEIDSDYFTGMDERKKSLDAGIGARYEWNDIRFSASLMTDVLSVSQGSEVSLSLSKVFNYGPFFFEPSIGVVSQDKNLVDYYYGVKTEEILQDRPQYNGDSAVNVQYGLSFMTPVLFKGLTRLRFSYTSFDDTIMDSPLVSGDNGVSAMFIYARMF